jgi:hypothetical protein
MEEEVKKPKAVKKAAIKNAPARKNEIPPSLSKTKPRSKTSRAFADLS